MKKIAEKNTQILGYQWEYPAILESKDPPKLSGFLSLEDNRYNTPTSSSLFPVLLFTFHGMFQSSRDQVETGVWLTGIAR